MRGYQLAPLIKKVDFFENSKQWGAMLYVRANYTSTTDPTTGWRKHIYIPYPGTKEIFNRYFGIEGKIEINYDHNQKCYRFEYADSVTNRKWQLFAYKGLERMTFDPKNRKVEKHDLFEQINDIFDGFDVHRNINEQISENDFPKWKSLIYYWKLLNQIRNVDRDKTGDENDFLQSPVWSNKINGFYDSRRTAEYKNKYGLTLPGNGDANGAYNIARKGLIVADRIKKDQVKPDLFISDTDWDNYAQKII